MRAVHGSVESTSAPTVAPAAASTNAAPSRSPVARSTPNAMTHQVSVGRIERAEQRGRPAAFTVQYCTAGPCGTRSARPGARKTIPKFGRSACSPT